MGSSPGKSVVNPTNATRTANDYACLDVKPVNHDDEEFYFFSSGPFSLWHVSRFQVESGLVFSSLGQYMLYSKAALFKDNAMCNQILLTTNPDELQTLVEHIEDFDPQIWFEHKTSILWHGNILKFSQNTDLLAILFRTHTKVLVYACEPDLIMGIGMTPENPRKCEIDNWRGYNILGMVLTGVREELMRHHQLLDGRGQEFSLRTIEKLYEHAIQQVFAASHEQCFLRPFTTKGKNKHRLKQHVSLDNTTADETDDYEDDFESSDDFVDCLDNIEDISEFPNNEDEDGINTHRTEFDDMNGNGIEASAGFGGLESPDSVSDTHCKVLKGKKQKAPANTLRDRTQRIDFANNFRDSKIRKDIAEDKGEHVIYVENVDRCKTLGFGKTSITVVNKNKTASSNKDVSGQKLDVVNDGDIKHTTSSINSIDNKGRNEEDRLSIASELSSAETREASPIRNTDFWDIESLNGEDLNLMD